MTDLHIHDRSSCTDCFFVTFHFHIIFDYYIIVILCYYCKPIDHKEWAASHTDTSRRRCRHTSMQVATPIGTDKTHCNPLQPTEKWQRTDHGMNAQQDRMQTHTHASGYTDKSQMKPTASYKELATVLIIEWTHSKRSIP